MRRWTDGFADTRALAALADMVVSRSHPMSFLKKTGL